MQIILTQSVRKLGKAGDFIKVRDGYGRNYLLPQNLAIRATKENIAELDSLKKQLQQKNQDAVSMAKKIEKSIANKGITFIVQSSADGKLFGSISSKSIAAKLSSLFDFDISYSQIMLDSPIKFNGVHEIKICLHPEVITEVLLIVAKSEEEAASTLQHHHDSKKETTDDKKQSEDKK